MVDVVIYDTINETNDSLLTYVIHHEPFPLKNTEMSVLYHFSKKGDGSRMVSWHEAWDVESAPPESKSYPELQLLGVHGTLHQFLVAHLKPLTQFSLTPRRCLCGL